MAKQAKTKVYAFKDLAVLDDRLLAALALLKLEGLTITKSELLRRLVAKGLTNEISKPKNEF